MPYLACNPLGIRQPGLTALFWTRKRLPMGVLNSKTPMPMGKVQTSFSIREKPVAPELRHVEQVTGGPGICRDDPLGGDDDIGFPGQIEMIQGAMEAGQLPEPQVIFPGDLVEILIAHDVVGLGLAHHGDRGRVRAPAPGGSDR